MMSKNNADFKQTLWKTADSLRAQMLIFPKYISEELVA